VSQDCDQYWQLPLRLIEDCRLIMDAEAQVRALQDRSKPTQDLIAQELGVTDWEQNVGT
jgi:hypothetical protein